MNELIIVMLEMLNQPKKIDELKLLPAYVKDGELFNFTGVLIGKTSKADGEIFSVDKVLNTQSVTAALKKNYTKALTAWLESPEVVEAKDLEVFDDGEQVEDQTDCEYNLIGDVEEYIKAKDYKGAKKLVKRYKDHVEYKKAKKLVKQIKG